MKTNVEVIEQMNRFDLLMQTTNFDKLFNKLRNSIILNDTAYWYNFLGLYLRLNKIEPSMLHPKHISQGLFYREILFTTMLENKFSKETELV
jgi:hypothetical protein